jgi:hypothetical protein
MGGAATQYSRGFRLPRSPSAALVACCRSLPFFIKGGSVAGRSSLAMIGSEARPTYDPDFSQNASSALVSMRAPSKSAAIRSYSAAAAW